MSGELDTIGRAGWRLYDTRCFGYLAHVSDGRPFVAGYDHAAAFPSAEDASRAAQALEVGRWRPVDRIQPPQVGPIGPRRPTSRPTNRPSRTRSDR